MCDLSGKCIKGPRYHRESTDDLFGFDLSEAEYEKLVESEQGRFTKVELDAKAVNSQKRVALLEHAIQTRKLSGLRVRVVGLSNKPELNGRFGTVCSMFAGMGRCAVRFDGGKTLSLRRDALEA